MSCSKMYISAPIWWRSRFVTFSLRIQVRVAVKFYYNSKEVFLHTLKYDYKKETQMLVTNTRPSVRILKHVCCQYTCIKLYIWTPINASTCFTNVSIINFLGNRSNLGTTNTHQCETLTHSQQILLVTTMASRCPAAPVRFLFFSFLVLLFLYTARLCFKLITFMLNNCIHAYALYIHLHRRTRSDIYMYTFWGHYL
jgi:hypothetical protein